MEIIKNGLSKEHNQEILKGLKICLDKNLPGDIFDIGCWTGTASFFMAEYLLKNGSDKTIFLFDTFDGHPISQKTEIDEKWKFNIKDFKNVATNEIEKVFSDMKFRNYEIVPGDIFETLDNFDGHKICFAETDLNHYSPTKYAVEFLRKNMVSNGIIFEDDFSHINGITQAWDESSGFVKLDMSNRGMFFQKI